MHLRLLHSQKSVKLLMFYMRQRLPQGNVDERDMIEVLEQAVLYYFFIFFYHGDDFAFDHFE